MADNEVGKFQIGTEAPAATVFRDPPTATITSPGSLVTDDTVTVVWTYSSRLSRPQATWQVILRREDGTLLFNTPKNSGTDTSFEVPFLLQPFSTYRVTVVLTDGIDDDSDAVTFTTQAFGEPNFPDNEQVGSVYEIAINGRGYMLADTPDRPARRQVGQLEPERFATGTTPFSEAVDRYTYLTFRDWSGGEGQPHLDKETSDPSRYWFSQLVDPFTVPGEIQPTKAMARKISSTHTNMQATVASGDLFVATSGSQLTHRDTTISGTNTTFGHGLASALTWLASDGVNWYATDGATIRRNDSAADPGANWSTVDVTEIGWIGDRLAGLDNAAANPNFTTFDGAGAEEVAGGRFPFPGADELVGIAAGDGFVWWGVNRISSSTIHAWQVDSPDSAFIALSLPLGEKVAGLFFYLGNVMIGTLTDDGRFKVYRAVPSEGRLTPQFVTETETAGGDRVWFAGHDRFVAFSWPGMTEGNNSGIGVMDLETGGYARFSFNNVGTTALDGVVAWEGEFAFTVTGDGAHALADSGAWTTGGFLITSSSSLNSVTVKSVDEVQIATHPLLNVASVDVSLSTDTNMSHQLVGTQDTEGSVGATFNPIVAGRDLAIRVDLTAENSGANASPRVKVLSVKLHPYNLADEVITLPINCADQIDGVNGRPLPESGPDTGLARAALLESLVGTNVALQYITWPATRITNVYQVVAADTPTTGTPDRHQNRRGDDAVCTLTLRRPST